MAYIAVGVIGGLTPMVMLILDAPIWVELYVVATGLSLSVFIFFGCVFYRGVRFDRKERFSPDDYRMDGGKNAEVNALLGTRRNSVGFGGAVFTYLSILYLIMTVIAFPLFYLLRKPLCRAVAAGRTCRKKMNRSLFLAARMAFYFTGWVFVVIVLFHSLER